MISVGQDGKVLKAIVRCVSVNMMDVFPRLKSSSKMLLHNPAVEAHLSSIG